MEELFMKKMETFQREVYRIKKQNVEDKTTLFSGEYAIMNLIAKYQEESNEKPTLVFLSRELGIRKATVTPLVERLVKKGYLLKETSEHDKRLKLITLTEKGISVLREQCDMEMERLRAVLQYMGEEDTKELIRMLDKVNTYFKANISE